MNFFGLEKLNISQRLSIGFGVVIGLLAVVTAVSVVSMRDTRDRVRTIDEQLRPKIDRIVSMKQHANQSGMSMRNLSILTTPEDLNREFKRLTTAYAEFDRLYAVEVGVAANADDKANLAKLAEDRTAATAMFQAAVKQAGSVTAVDDIAVLVRLELRMNLDAWTKAQEQWLADIDARQATTARIVAAQQQALVQQADQGITLLLAVAGVAIAFGVVASRAITRSVKVPLLRAVSEADRMADGDLSHPIDSRGTDEMGLLLTRLEAMRSRWSGTVSELRASTQSITIASSEIALGNQDLSQRTEQTASNLEETASSIARLTGTVQQSAESARQANQMASSAATVAERGGVVVSQVVTTMSEIQASSQKIADIIGVIDGIAFQTNILALNAAVEAARAGEQGRGFAVVASEVRSLAGRSASAAREIKALIGTSVDRVAAGARLVSDAGQTMGEIVGAVKRVSGIIGEITATSSEQSDGLSKVNATVTQLEQMTQQNAALVEESAAAADSLESQALHLSKLMGNFRLDDGVAGLSLGNSARALGGPPALA